MNIKIKAKNREIGNKSDLTRFRNEGYIPAVIYGEGKIGKNILIDRIAFNKSYKKTIGEVAIFDIDVEGSKFSTFIKEKQIHPVTREIIHVDFVELHKGKPITLEIPINFVGEAKGAKEGGMVEYLHRSIVISCLPKDIPEEIEVDISHLGIGDALHFADLNLPDTLSTTMTEETALVSVKEPSMKLKTDTTAEEQGEDILPETEEENSEQE
jgi:large subunit ribosomal protein L25